MAAMSFTVIGDNLVVHSPGSYVHVYDVESINCDDEQMSNGLYHMFLPGKIKRLIIFGFKFVETMFEVL